MQEIFGFVFIALGLLCGAAHIARYRGALSFEPFSKLPAMERSLGPRRALALHVSQYVLGPVGVGVFLLMRAHQQSADVAATEGAWTGVAAGLSRQPALAVLLVLSLLLGAVSLATAIRRNRALDRRATTDPYEPDGGIDRLLRVARIALSIGFVVVGLYIAFWRPRSHEADRASACAERDDALQFAGSDVTGGPWTADHYAFFAEEGPAQRFANDVDARGFEIQELSLVEVRDPEPRQLWRVLFRRQEWLTSPSSRPPRASCACSPCISTARTTDGKWAVTAPSRRSKCWTLRAADPGKVWARFSRPNASLPALRAIPGVALPSISKHRSPRRTIAL